MVASVLVFGGGLVLAVWWSVRTLQGAFDARAAAVPAPKSDLELEPAGGWAGRFAAVERRMEELEQDALHYLRKGSQRAEQAKRREKRNSANEEVDPAVASDEEREQLELTLAGGGNGATTQAVASLNDVRSRM